MHKIILDTDPGVDDSMAIAYALAHPDIELLALTVVFGNINIDFATRNAQYVLDVLGANDVAVAKGAAIPSVQPPRPYADFVHGTDGLGNVYPGSVPGVAATESALLRADARHSSIEPLDAADFIINAARENPGQITLVAVGPLTNIAEALRREPALPELVAGLVIMGGTVDEPGNVSPLAEANFLNDPHAADALFAVHWPATLVGLDVTHKIMLKDSHLKSLGENAALSGQLIWTSSRFYVDFYTQSGAAKEAVARGDEPQCAMHDAAAIAYVVMPEAFTTESGSARVVDEGIAIGQLALDRKGYDYPLPFWQNRPATSVCMNVDSEAVRQNFLQTIIDHHIR
ncbi:MAG: purine nucleosidase [Granulosicoccus sp.]|jgi:inosine-uridine nucleoside N-ribohydrolase